MNDELKYIYVLNILKDGKSVNIIGFEKIQVLVDLLSDFITVDTEMDQKGFFRYVGMTRKQADKAGLSPVSICLGRTEESNLK